MSVILEYSMQSDGLVLTETLAATEVRLEIERITAPDPETHLLFAWVWGSDLDAFEAAAATDPTVEEPTVLSDVGDGRLYSMRVTDATEVVLYPAWAKLGGEGLEATHEDGWWHSRIRFPDRDAINAYHDFLEANGVAFRLNRLYDSDGSETADDGLSDEQRETLKLAYERGYFDIPRRTTTNALAEELEVSDQAVSERLRRGYRRLVELQVGVGEDA